MDRRIFVISSRSNEPSFLVRDVYTYSSGEQEAFWELVSIRDPFYDDDHFKVTVKHNLDPEDILELLTTNNRITVFNGQRRTAPTQALRRFVGKCLWDKTRVTSDDFITLVQDMGTQSSNIFWT